MTRPWNRIEDLFEPPPGDVGTVSSDPVDEAVQVFGFDAVYGRLQQMADEAQDRLNGQEGSQ